MNSVNLVGRLCADIELRRTNNGTAVTSYSLAVRRPMVKDTTDFIECVTWQQGAEYLSKYAHKGDLIAVSGTLQARKWTDKHGNNRTAFEVVTTSVELVSSKRNSEGNTNPTQNQSGQPGSAGAPQSQYNQQGFGGYQGNAYQAQGFQPPQPNYAVIDEDDARLPF